MLLKLMYDIYEEQTHIDSSVATEQCEAIARQVSCDSYEDCVKNLQLILKALSFLENRIYKVKDEHSYITN